MTPLQIAQQNLADFTKSEQHPGQMTPMQRNLYYSTYNKLNTVINQIRREERKELYRVKEIQYILKVCKVQKGSMSTTAIKGRKDINDGWFIYKDCEDSLTVYIRGQDSVVIRRLQAAFNINKFKYDLSNSYASHSNQSHWTFRWIV
jgi:hypothetical protein